MKLCQCIAVASVIICWGLAFYYFSKLPPTIPIHFDAAGKPNNWGSRSSIFLFPVIGTILVFGINALAKYPHIFNYAQKVTEQNASRLYKQGIKMLYIVNAIVGFILMICVISTLTAVFNTDNQMDSWSLPLILLLSGSLVAYSVIAAVKSTRIKWVTGSHIVRLRLS